MQWLLIGVLLGSIVTSGHKDREECEGRAVLLREKGASVSCYQSTTWTSTGSTLRFCSTTGCQ